MFCSSRAVLHDLVVANARAEGVKELGLLVHAEAYVLEEQRLCAHVVDVLQRQNKRVSRPVQLKQRMPLQAAYARFPAMIRIL